MSIRGLLTRIPNAAINSGGYIYRSLEDANLSINAHGYLSRGEPNIYIAADGTLYRCLLKPENAWIKVSGMEGVNWLTCLYTGNGFIAVGNEQTATDASGESVSHAVTAVSDDGITWQQYRQEWKNVIGKNGTYPTSHAAYGNGTFAVISAGAITGDRGIYCSKDGGKTLTEVSGTGDNYVDLGSWSSGFNSYQHYITKFFTDIAFGNGVFVATMFTNEVERLITSAGVTTLKNERNAYFMVSSNGTSWTKVAASNAPYYYIGNERHSPYYRSITFMDGYFYAAASGEVVDEVRCFKCAKSLDGMFWQENVMENHSHLVMGLFSLNGTLCSVGWRCWETSDGAFTHTQEIAWSADGNASWKFEDCGGTFPNPEYIKVSSDGKRAITASTGDSNGYTYLLYRFWPYSKGSDLGQPFSGMRVKNVNVLAHGGNKFIALGVPGNTKGAAYYIFRRTT